MCLRRRCKVTRAKRVRSFAFQPLMSKLSWRRPWVSCLRLRASLADIRDRIDRVVISHATIRIHLSEAADESDGARILTLPWTRPSPYRKREILQGADDAKLYARPMSANARAVLIGALRDAHRWLGELLSDPRLTLELVASREGKTERSIRLTLSLAFLAPEIVKVAVEVRLPRGFGLKRLVDLPMAWPDQWRTLGSRRQRKRNERSPHARCLPPTRRSAPSESAQSVELLDLTCHRDRTGSGAANSNLGNRILRPETFDRTCRQ